MDWNDVGVDSPTVARKDGCHAVSKPRRWRRVRATWDLLGWRWVVLLVAVAMAGFITSKIAPVPLALTFQAGWLTVTYGVYSWLKLVDQRRLYLEEVALRASDKAAALSAQHPGRPVEMRAIKLHLVPPCTTYVIAIAVPGEPIRMFAGWRWFKRREFNPTPDVPSFLDRYTGRKYEIHA